MGIRLHEVTPILGLAQNDTRELARFLCSKRNAYEQISGDDLKTAINEFDRSRQGNLFNLVRTASFNELTDALEKAGWLEGVPDRSGYILTRHVLDSAAAVNGQRMTFAEACTKIIDLRERLSHAPDSINGITVNRVLIYGSTVRDKNSTETIGDLDMIVDMAFDERFNNIGIPARTRAAQEAWEPIISAGDERLGFFAGVESCRQHFDTTQGITDSFGHPRILMQIWRNENLRSSSLSPEEINAINILQERTVQTQNRARILYEILSTTCATRPGAPARQTKKCEA